MSVPDQSPDAATDNGDDDEHGNATSGGSSPIDDFLDATISVDDPTACEVLREGEMEIHGRMPYSSNGTCLVSISHPAGRAQAIYKPERGERPLWDYPSGLWRREVATYELSRQLGWDLVPPTVEVDGPLGVGSVQYYVPCDANQHYFTIFDDGDHDATLRAMAAFDIVANNCDRKGGHVLLSADAKIWGIDHGLNFHDEDKLRTVIWDYAGAELPDEVRRDLATLLDDGLSDGVLAYLSDAEADATVRRAGALVASGRFPHDPTGRRVPWPLV